MCSELEVREILVGKRAVALVSVVDSAWKAHVEEKRARWRRTRANIVQNHMIDFADREFATLDGVVPFKRYGIQLYAVDDRIVLSAKMHDRQFGTKNHRSDHQDRLRAQGHLDGMPELCHIRFGYVLDKAEASVERIVLTRHIKNKLEWWIDLRELAVGVTEPATPMIPELDPAHARRLVIVPPAETGEGGTSE